MESGGGGGGWRDRLGWFLWPRSIDRAVADNASTHEHAHAASSDTTNTRAEIHGPAGSLDEALLLRLRLRGGGKTIIACKKCGGERQKYTPCLLPCEFGKMKMEPTKDEKEAKKAFLSGRIKRKAPRKQKQKASATRLAEGGRAIELDADGLPWIAPRPRLAPPPESLPLKQKMLLRLRPGCEY